MSTISNEEMEIYKEIRKVVSRIISENSEGVPTEYSINPEDTKRKTIPKDEKKVTEILTNLGIPRNVDGFFFLRAAICYCIEDERLLKAITKKLYPKVAKKFKTTSSKVERAIRYAIGKGCDKGDLEYIQRVFGSTIDGLKGKPTNAQFIAMIVDEVKLHNL